MRSIIISIFSALVISPLAASPITEISFSYKDWDIACYSSGTCQTTGPGLAGSDISVILTRKAGPYQDLSGKVQFASAEQTATASSLAVLYINEQVVGEIPPDNGDFVLSLPQITALLDALKRDLKIEFAIGSQRYALSSAGSNAVLLKMDEFQGRINTPGALIRPGNKDENSVPAASVVKTPQELASLEQQALQQLYQTLIEVQNSDPELLLSSLDHTMEKLSAAGEMTKFTVNYETETPSPETKPSPDITNDEWRAFLRSDVVSAEGESRSADYALIDLDGDGKRDLIIESYTGGTGLFSYAGVLKRGKDRFYSTNDDTQADEFVPGGFYSLNGRGANQYAWWITLQGQVYALWLNSRFGTDDFYLLRPFSKNKDVPIVTVRYRYDMALKEAWQDENVRLNEHEHEVLLQHLVTMQDKLLSAETVTDERPAVCPIPDGISNTAQESYYFGRPVHYSLEQVSLIPVWINHQCYIGTVASYFGSYAKDQGTNLEIAIDSPRKGEEISAGYTFSGLRKVVSVKPYRAIRTGDNGI
ncbi:DUF1176 domain-containing protein [Chromatiaceae bacterium AAb-1]|nr:DUF1176 domain-containing protein [Chromatiaceae bacterium AAb-1]